MVKFWSTNDDVRVHEILGKLIKVEGAHASDFSFPPIELTNAEPAENKNHDPSRSHTGAHAPSIGNSGSHHDVDSDLGYASDGLSDAQASDYNSDPDYESDFEQGNAQPFVTQPNPECKGDSETDARDNPYVQRIMDDRQGGMRSVDAGNDDRMSY
jgi:hypothetical protein